MRDRLQKTCHVSQSFVRGCCCCGQDRALFGISNLFPCHASSVTIVPSAVKISERKETCRSRLHLFKVSSSDRERESLGKCFMISWSLALKRCWDMPWRTLILFCCRKRQILLTRDLVAIVSIISWGIYCRIVPMPISTIKVLAMSYKACQWESCGVHGSGCPWSWIFLGWYLDVWHPVPGIVPSCTLECLGKLQHTPMAGSKYCRIGDMILFHSTYVRFKVRKR